MNNHLMSFGIFFPLFGIIFQSFFRQNRSRLVALLGSVASSVCIIALLLSVQTQAVGLHAVESFEWIGSYSIVYEMALDGLNVLLALLIAILFPVLIAAEWTQEVGQRGMYSLFLILQTTLLGTIFAQDLFLQFFFWGVSALPFYFLVGIWGSSFREQAAFRSIVASSLGNMLFFIALVLIYHSSDPHTFSIKHLSSEKLSGCIFEIFGISFSLPKIAFTLICLGLAMRAPIWPLHGWFIQIAEVAPPSVFVALLVGAVPVALYLFLKIFYLLFPNSSNYLSQVIVVVGGINLVMGAFCAIAQKGLSRLLAFIGLGQVGLVLVGVGSSTPAGIVGAVYHLFILGLSLAGFGLFSGVITDRMRDSVFLGDKNEPLLGGIAVKAPIISIVSGIIICSLLGFPGLSGFVSHSLIIIGSYAKHPSIVFLAIFTLLLSSFCLFSMYRHVFLGERSENGLEFLDLTLREKLYFLPIVGCLLFFGLYPKPLIELVRPAVLSLLSAIK